MVLCADKLTPERKGEAKASYVAAGVGQTDIRDDFRGFEGLHAASIALIASSVSAQ